jgi:transcriptional regulator with XRE-family HTH domain
MQHSKVFYSNTLEYDGNMMYKIGDSAREAREIRGLSITKLSDMTGLSKSTISEFERGIRLPSSASLISIADVLHISLDKLIGREGFENGKKHIGISD